MSLDREFKVYEASILFVAPEGAPTSMEISSADATFGSGVAPLDSRNR
jgi:hypothetical protein